VNADDGERSVLQPWVARSQVSLALRIHMPPRILNSAVNAWIDRLVPCRYLRRAQSSATKT